MGSLSTGGGSSAVAASAHAGCERYRHTDPLVVGHSRRALAKELGQPDTTAGIPEARWMRAMAFERLIRDDRFVSQLLTTAVGALGLDRPTAVRRADGAVSVATTATKLVEAHRKAVDDNVATMLTSLAVPFVGMEAVAGATPVKPDFAIVVPRPAESAEDGEEPAIIGSWLVMGDAKDYERVRSRIDDPRMLKGFLQVALGAESAADWGKVPDGMVVHPYGVLAVPRNAFLQPEAVVELLDDHRREVRVRVDERSALLEKGDEEDRQDVHTFVGHLSATFDPASCAACALFNYCRTELRASDDPEAILTEVGIRPELRHAVLGVLDGSGVDDAVPASVVAGIQATIEGAPVWTGQRRVDPVGQPGSINVVLAKSDAAALGIHGIGLQRIASSGEPCTWQFSVFDEPQSPDTRLAVMGLVGREIEAAVQSDPGTTVCIVTPDGPTADVLVSIADSLAGVETSRLRWQRDLDEGRPALTFDGEPALVPAPLSEAQRVGVSFLLEEDRARAMTLRWPIVDVRRVLSGHLVAGGPGADSGRLDYLLEWAEANTPLDHRTVSDDVAARLTTPGARLSNARSDDLHTALRGRRGRNGEQGEPDLPSYRELVREEVGYKADVLSRAAQVLEVIDVSKLREAHLALEHDAQVVWHRRLALHASDLVRFGRTSWVWRNKQVEMLDDDKRCATQLAALGNPQVARDLAVAAGTREVALATVASVDPVRVVVRSRQIGDGSAVVALHVNGEPLVERPAVSLSVLKGSLKFGQMHRGFLTDDGEDGLRWDLGRPLELNVGDELTLADLGWFNSLNSDHQLSVSRPAADTQNAPKPDCFPDSYENDPDEHQWCCRSHEDAEAEWSDVLAERRARGELNPQAWPPVIDEDQFDTPAEGSPTDADVVGDDPQPDDLTIDDLD